MARPTSLTPEVHARIIALVRGGNYRVTAMRACGLSKNLVRNWEQRGEDGEEPYASFAAELQEAEALSEADMLAEIRDPAAAVPWQANIAILERRFSARWCARINHHKQETEDAILAKLRAHPKLHAEVAHVLAADADTASGTAPSH